MNKTWPNKVGFLLIGLCLFQFASVEVWGQSFSGLKLGSNTREALRGARPGSDAPGPIESGGIDIFGKDSGAANDGKPDDPFNSLPDPGKSLDPSKGKGKGKGDDPFGKSDGPGADSDGIGSDSNGKNKDPKPSPKPKPSPNPQPSNGLGAEIVAFAKANLGKKVNNGECAMLVVDAFKVVGAVMPKHQGVTYIWGDKVADQNAAQPGDIIQFENVKFEKKLPKGGRSTSSMAHHTAIVAEGLEPGVYKILHQNVGGSKLVQYGTINLGNRKPGGSLVFYRPQPKKPKGGGKSDGAQDGGGQSGKTCQVILYGRPACGLCKATKSALNKENILFTEKNIDSDKEAAKKMWDHVASTGKGGGSISLPVVVAGGKVFLEPTKNLGKFIDDVKNACKGTKK